MTASDPAEDQMYGMGCMMDFPMAKWGCHECNFLEYEDGSTKNPRRDRALGAVVGLAVGDALGEPYEFKPPVTEDTPITMDYNDNWHPGRWTDDTAMTIGIMQAWANHRTILTVQAQDELVAIWRKWSESATDVGVQTRRVLHSLDELSAERCNEAAYQLHLETGRSGGNGSLMRTAPLAFLRIPDADLARVVTQISKLTHYDDDAAYACIIWVFAIRHAIKTGDLDFSLGFEYLPESARATWRGYLEEAENNLPVHFENNGWVVAAFKAAASAVMIGEYGFVPGIEAAVRAGFDTDTVAAIAGSFLGALHGTSGIPDHWIEPLHGWPNYKTQDLTKLVTSVQNLSDYR
jgi:ADP-ribosyl-[dinitrogen reductase] hydrolase